MESFRQDNTEGYTDEQLSTFNQEWAERVEKLGLDEDDPDYGHFEKAFSDEVARRCMTTKTAQHTPGPWDIVDDIYVLCAEELTICKTEQAHSVRSHETNTANARLIASAPDLLEALQVLTELCEGKEIFSLSIAQSHEAIAKATGEET